MSQNVPKGSLKRSTIATTAAAKVGFKQLTHLSKRPFLSVEKRSQHKQETNTANAKTIFNALSQLRGTALKVAQMLSMETEMLPKQYQQELSKSYHQVPPLNRALMRKVISQELGASPETLFASFESQAFAAASLGQVHAATTKDNQPLAIKIQYPGIDLTIHSDIQLVKKLISPLQDSKSLIGILEEIESRMKEETNYQYEADNLRWFANNITANNIIIPKVYEQWSSQHVLSMQRLEGLHLQAWLATNPSQTQRNRAAQTIYDLYIHTVFELQRFHADPNPGNYLFREDGNIGLVDFGCIKQLTPVFSRNLSTLYQSINANDMATLFKTYKKLGMIKDEADEEFSEVYFETILQPFFTWVTKPFKHESFDFSQHKNYARESLNLVEKIRKYKGKHHGSIELNNNFVFTDRTLYGLYKIFEQLGATVQMRNRWTCK